MRRERTDRITVTAEEVARLLGIQGEIVSFDTPSRQSYDGKVGERFLLIIVKTEVDE